ncbi:MAG: hypothetical protein VXU44_00665 [Chloroflexota bacterium]|nr:hypothetical protein [Chloroflexota bacterium]
MKFRNLSKFAFFFVFSLIIFSSNSNISADSAEEDWSAFGRIAYEIENGSDKDIIVWDADTDWENGRKWTVRLDGIEDMDECNVIQPSLSKDGRWLAFSTDCDFYGQNPNFQNWIGIVNLENTSEWYPITAGSNKKIDFHANNPSWDPTGSKLAFDSDILNDGKRRIFTIDVYDQIDASASGKISSINQLTPKEAWDPDYSPDGNFIAAMTPGGIDRIWSDGNASLISKHSFHESDNVGGGIVVRTNYGKNEYYGENIVEYWGMLECDPRAEVFAYHTDGRVKGDGEDDVDDGSSKIIVTCEHGIDENTPANITSRDDYSTYVSHRGDTGCCMGYFPEVSPDGRGIAYLNEVGEIMAKSFWGGRGLSYQNGHFADNSDVGIGNFSKEYSPISWSAYSIGLDGSEGLEIGVGAIELKLDVGGGVNDIFRQEDSLEDQFDRQVQLEIDRINSYITELEFQRESNLKMLEFDIDAYMQGHNSYIQQEESRVAEVEYRWEFEINDLQNLLAFELEYFDEQTEFELFNIQNMTQSDSSWRIQELELQYQRDIEDAKMFHQEEYQRFEFDYQIRVGDIDNYYNGEIARAQSDGDNEFVEFLMQEKQREKDDAFNEYQFRIFDQQAYETQDLQNREFDFQNQKANLERDIAREIQNRESNLINYTNQRALEREDLIARFQFDIESREMQRDQDVEMVRQQVEFALQQFNFNLEREEMNWDLRRQQIQSDYENQLRDFQNQIEQVKFQAEVDKERLSMDKEQFEAEMMQLEREIQSRQSDADNFYNDSLAELTIEADMRLQELENRRVDENWSDERYQQELAEYDKWYSDRTYEIQSNYDSSMREIDFDQRQYQNFQTVVESNELYQEGERGFFGNPIPGTVRQGGFTDDLSDPGNLAMIGIIVTVGTTLLQLARGK